MKPKSNDLDFKIKEKSLFANQKKYALKFGRKFKNSDF